MDRVALKQRVNEHLTSILPPWPTISFRHPAYPDPEDILFKLPRLDHAEQTSTALGPERETVYGVHHRTALLACQIIANNAFDGYLATDRDGHEPVVVAPDGILTRGSYWFIADRHGDGSTGRNVDGGDVYPVVPRFEEWEFPHGGFAALGWDALPTGHAERPVSTGPPSPTFAVPPLPGQRCIISNNIYAVHRAHLVPSAHIDWYQRNSMRRYEDDQEQPRLIDTNRNQVCMRHDLHTVWDAHMFALIPKRDSFVVHVLATPTPGIREFAAQWQDVPVQRGALQRVGKAYLFAKFAQAVFMLAKPFVAYSAVSRYVARRQAQTTAGGSREAYEVTMQWLSESSLRRMYSGGGLTKSTSASSGRKRSRSQATGDNELDEEGGWNEAKSSVWAYDSDDESKREGQWYENNARGRLWASESDEEAKREGEWYENNARGRLWACDPDDESGRGRPRKRRQQCDRSEYTVDTVPSLTDTSAIGVEDPDLNASSQAEP